MLDYIVKYDQENVIKPMEDKMKIKCDALEADIQQTKSYVLSLEEAINTLKAENAEYRKNFEDVGKSLAEMDLTVRNMQLIKKKKFWNKN